MKDVEAGSVIAGKYRLLRRISGGGMGAVWLAHHGQLDAPVVLKFMHGSLLDVQGARARFEREAKAAAKIRSPHVVHVYDHGIDGETGAPFIVMEYLEGEDLRRRLRRARQLAPEEAARICEQICKGLHRAHSLGIVHRDLKPANIFLSEADDDMVKILDFGIAKETGQRRVVKGETTTTGQVLGSPHYMSPEQARGLALDGRSDLWSVAVIMFRALTGRRPFDGEDIGDLIVRICTDPVPRASSLAPHLGSIADAFFDRAFARDPAARFPTAKAFAAEFRVALLGARAIAPLAAAAGEPSASHSSWDSRRSASFSSSAAMDADMGDDAVTLLTPPTGDGDELLRTPVAASHSLDTPPRPLRSRRKLYGGALVALLLGGAVAAALFVGARQASDSAVAPAASTPSPAPTVASAAIPDPPASSEPPESDEDAAASAEASAAPAPVQPPVGRLPRPRPAPPPPSPETDPDLGY